MWDSSFLKSSMMSSMDSEKMKRIFAQVSPLFDLCCGKNFVSFERNLEMEDASLMETSGEARKPSGALSSASSQ